jgi:hypothetical protein
MPGTTDIISVKDGLIDRYLNNALNDVERAAFELMMLEDEQLFARVQLLDSFKNSLIDERAALSVKRELLALPFRAWLQQPLSLAASVLVLGLGLQMVYATIATRSTLPAAVGIDSVFVLEATRGVQRPILSGAAPYLFQIDAGPDAANTPVAVTLRAADGAELLRVDDLQVDTNGWARVVFDQALAGDYTLELVGSADFSSIRTFDITIND